MLRFCDDGIIIAVLCQNILSQCVLATYKLEIFTVWYGELLRGIEFFLTFIFYGDLTAFSHLITNIIFSTLSTASCAIFLFILR